MFDPVTTVSYSVVVGGGVSGRWREGSCSVLVFFPGGLPEWGHFSNLGLGLGCFGPCGCLVVFVHRSVSGSKIVLEGIV